MVTGVATVVALYPKLKGIRLKFLTVMIASQWDLYQLSVSPSRAGVCAQHAQSLSSAPSTVKWYFIALVYRAMSSQTGLKPCPALYAQVSVEAAADLV